jgi:hypothetical protein
MRQWGREERGKGRRSRKSGTMNTPVIAITNDWFPTKTLVAPKTRVTRGNISNEVSPLLLATKRYPIAVNIGFNGIKREAIETVRGGAMVSWWSNLGSSQSTIERRNQGVYLKYRPASGFRPVHQHWLEASLPLQCRIVACRSTTGLSARPPGTIFRRRVWRGSCCRPSTVGARTCTGSASKCWSQMDRSAAS